MENNHKFYEKFAWLLVAVFAFRCLLGKGLGENLFSLYQIWGNAGESIAFTVALSTLYEKWLWRFNPFEKMPKLYKEYQGMLKSSHDKNQIERKITVRIKQSLLSINVSAITDESHSSSIAASIINNMGEYVLIYSYINQPRTINRKNSEIHYGTARFCIDNVNSINGEYFTDRSTRGSIDLSRR